MLRCVCTVDCSYSWHDGSYALLLFDRYLRAIKWESPQKAIKRLEETLQWRRDFGFYDERSTPDYVEPEVCTESYSLVGLYSLSFRL